MLDCTKRQKVQSAKRLYSIGGHFEAKGQYVIVTMQTERRITSQDVIDQLYELFIFRGIPEHIRSDNGPEFTNTETGLLFGG